MFPFVWIKAATLANLKNNLYNSTQPIARLNQIPPNSSHTIINYNFAGTHPTPFLKPILEEQINRTNLSELLILMNEYKPDAINNNPIISNNLIIKPTSIITLTAPSNIISSISSDMPMPIHKNKKIITIQKPIFINNLKTKKYNTNIKIANLRWIKTIINSFTTSFTWLISDINFHISQKEIKILFFYYSLTDSKHDKRTTYLTKKKWQLILYWYTFNKKKKDRIFRKEKKKEDLTKYWIYKNIKKHRWWKSNINFVYWYIKLLPLKAIPIYLKKIISLPHFSKHRKILIKALKKHTQKKKIEREKKIKIENLKIDRFEKTLKQILFTKSSIDTNTETKVQTIKILFNELQNMYSNLKLHYNYKKFRNPIIKNQIKLSIPITIIDKNKKINHPDLLWIIKNRLNLPSQKKKLNWSPPPQKKKSPKNKNLKLIKLQWKINKLWTIKKLARFYTRLAFKKNRWFYNLSTSQKNQYYMNTFKKMKKSPPKKRRRIRNWYLIKHKWMMLKKSRIHIRYLKSTKSKKNSHKSRILNYLNYMIKDTYDFKSYTPINFNNQFTTPTDLKPSTIELINKDKPINIEKESTSSHTYTQEYLQAYTQTYTREEKITNIYSKLLYPSNFSYTSSDKNLSMIEKKKEKEENEKIEKKTEEEQEEKKKEESKDDKINISYLNLIGAPEISNYPYPIDDLSLLTANQNKYKKIPTKHLFQYKTTIQLRNEITKLSFVLSKIFNKKTELIITRLRYPHFNTTILSKRLTMFNKRRRFYTISLIQFHKSRIKRIWPRMKKSIDSHINKGLPYQLSGLQLTLSGRWVRERTRPKKTRQFGQWGKFTPTGSTFISKANIAQKNKKGIFSITSWISITNPIIWLTEKFEMSIQKIESEAITSKIDFKIEKKYQEKVRKKMKQQEINRIEKTLTLQIKEAKEKIKPLPNTKKIKTSLYKKIKDPVKTFTFQEKLQEKKQKQNNNPPFISKPLFNIFNNINPNNTSRLIPRLGRKTHKNSASLIQEKRSTSGPKTPEFIRYFHTSNVLKHENKNKPKKDNNKTKKNLLNILPLLKNYILYLSIYSLYKLRIPFLTFFIIKKWIQNIFMDFICIINYILFHILFYIILKLRLKYKKIPIFWYYGYIHLNRNINECYECKKRIEIIKSKITNWYYHYLFKTYFPNIRFIFAIFSYLKKEIISDIFSYLKKQIINLKKKKSTPAIWPFKRQEEKNTWKPILILIILIILYICFQYLKANIFWW